MAWRSPRVPRSVMSPVTAMTSWPSWILKRSASWVRRRSVKSPTLFRARQRQGKGRLARLVATHGALTRPSRTPDVLVRRKSSNSIFTRSLYELLRKDVIMSLRINSEAPNFTADTTQGKISFHDWIGNGWAILFSHPKDFTPVCTTELGYMAGLKPEFDKRNTKIIGLSVDPVDNHARWAKDIEETQGHAINYPMIGDPELKVAMAYDMLPEGAGTK